MKKVLILGGAGFIGSQIAKKFSKFSKVTIIDGLVEGAGGNIENICDIEGIVFFENCIENVTDLADIVSKQDIIIDSMGWTSHLGAINDPLFDLKLNLLPHIYLLDCLKDNINKNSLVIFLGSTAQYGNSQFHTIDETANMLPIDIQGINKVSAENYFRVYSHLYGINVVSLRIPNCYGENQPYVGKDIGLIGGFIRNGLLNKNIDVYGSDRKRNVIFVEDLVDVIQNILLKENVSFEAYNVPCVNIRIQEIAEEICNLIDQCSVSIEKIPENIKKIDGNGYMLDYTKIIDKKINYKMNSLEQCLEMTIRYFSNKIL